MELLTPELRAVLIANGAAGSIFAGQGAIIDLGADPDPVTRARAFTPGGTLLEVMTEE